MASTNWYSQLFENESGGGVLLALPYEGLADWVGAGDDYEDVTADADTSLVRPIGKTFGLFVGDAEGIHEAHWVRTPDQTGVTLVV